MSPGPPLPTVIRRCDPSEDLFEQARGNVLYLRDARALRQLAEGDLAAAIAALYEGWPAHVTGRSGPQLGWVRRQDRLLRARAGRLQLGIDLAILARLRARRRLMVIAGAGVGASVHFPMWGPFLVDLLDLAGARGEDPRRRQRLGRVADDLRNRLRAGRDTGDSILRQAAELLIGAVGDRLPNYIRSVLLRARESATGGPAPDFDFGSPLLDALVDLTAPLAGQTRPAVGSLVTYNYDDLIERALLRRGRSVHVHWRYGQWLDTRLGPTDRKNEVNVYHAHGYVPLAPDRDPGRRRSEIILGGSQYATQYADHFSAAKQSHEPLLFRTRVLFVGCSLSDAYVRRELREHQRQRPGVLHFATMPVPRSALGPTGQADEDQLDRHTRRLLRLGVRPLWVDRHEDVPALIQAIVTGDGATVAATSPGSPRR